ncbi:hypothetical protein J4E00_10590 [Siccationidurans soli]|uniref:Copper-binding protein MbnP-like domain-containing protein n=2 Tax=Hymenobacter negativus TaxID=2795026 RepID=A0ABS3QE25_9BACT|nr:hypothetical protein [Hymenobacter negativus]
MFGAEKLALETKAYPTSQNGPVTIATFRFYLSALRLTYTDGSTYTEPNSFHLIDAEIDASQAFTLSTAPTKPLRSISFCVGVDSLTNTSGAHGGDLEPGRGMYWAWHSGYINAKLEGRSPACANPRKAFEFHIGGFQAPYRSLRPVTLVVPFGAGASLVIRADAARWLGQLKLADNSSVLVPGAAAMRVADGYAGMFSIGAGDEE